MANKHQVPFFEASAKEGTNVKELFVHFANLIYQKLEPEQNPALDLGQSFEQPKRKEEQQTECCT